MQCADLCGGAKPKENTTGCVLFSRRSGESLHQRTIGMMDSVLVTYLTGICRSSTRTFHVNGVPLPKLLEPLLPVTALPKYCCHLCRYTSWDISSTIQVSRAHLLMQLLIHLLAHLLIHLLIHPFAHLLIHLLVQPRAHPLRPSAYPSAHPPAHLLLISCATWFTGIRKSECGAARPSPHS